MAGEEPEFAIRCFATKHSWRGRYRRIFCVTASAIVTLDPSTLASTNTYDLLSEFESVSVTPSASRDDPQVGACHCSLSMNRSLLHERALLGTHEQV